MLAPGGDDVLEGGAGRDRVFGQVVQGLEIGIAKDQAVVRIPQHESFGNGFDRVAQAKVGGNGLFDQALLLRDVDGDTDQMQAGLTGLAHQLAACPHPHPFSAGVMHPEGMVDGAGLGIGEAGRKLVEVDVLGMHEGVDLAEGHQVVFRVEAENGEHRMRPEDAAAREVPVPEAAAAAVERGVDPAADGVIDQVGFAGARGLPMESEAEDREARSQWSPTA